MFSDDIEKYSKALVIGTGGGNDIVSAIVPVIHLAKHGINSDVSGILSPAAIHTFNGNIEKTVNEITDEVKRYIPLPDKKIEISFVDYYLPKICEGQKIEIERFYDFSTRFGTSSLVRGINHLIRENNYDLVLAVDVGGDILARGRQDNTLLSPMMDFTSLYVLSQLECDVMLLEFGLGTDGELRPKGMREILSELRENKIMINESEISCKNDGTVIFEKVYDEIRNIRRGNTILRTLQSLKTENDIIADYTFRSQIENRIWQEPFKIRLPGKYAGKTFLLDAKRLAQRRSKTAFGYKNCLEQYVKLKNMCPEWCTEMDLYYIWDKDNWTNPNRVGSSLFFLTPSTRITDRMEIIRYGINNCKADMTLILNEDLNHLGVSDLKYIEAGKFALIYKENWDVAKDTARRVKLYQ